MESVLVGEQAPDFEFELLDKSKRRLSDVVAEGLPVLILFYCNFCPQCGASAQKMEELAEAQTFKGRVNFILINLRGIEDAIAYKGLKDLRDACPHGAAEVEELFDVNAIPHTTLIDADGTILRNDTRLEWEELDRLLHTAARPSRRKSNPKVEGMLPPVAI
mmetsp:Transcript_40266/g.110798  ORF Transcript_40266/g.110798 Transcript_40266/m.110798 type:complete len:162 (-) Transcript_40266:193-678(-)